MPYQKLKSERYANVGGINQKKSHYVTGDNEVLDLWNYDFSEVGAWTKRWGSTSALAGSTLGAYGNSHRINNMWQTQAEFTVTGSPATFVSTDYELIPYDTVFFRYDSKASGYSGSLLTIPGFSNTPVNVNQAVVGSFSFFSTGYTGGQFFKNSNGYRVGYFGLPMVSVTSIATNGAGALTGDYNFALAYYDYLGNVGPISQTLAITGLVANSVKFLGITITGANTLFDPKGYVIYRNSVTGFATTELASVKETDLIYSGGSFNGFSLSYDGSLSNAYTLDRIPNTNPQYTRVPDFLEVYNSVLWLGFSSDNTVDYSVVEEPENILPENNLGFTFNKFKMTGLKFFNQSLMVFLQKGIFRVTGDNSASVNSQQLTSEYGLVSHKATVVWNERLWFLDEHDIVEFDGSNFKTVTDPIIDYMKRMNLSAALQRACAYHFTERQEVWFCIPIDGATDNNICLVYDYTVGAWTTFRGFIPTYLTDLYVDNDGDGFVEKRVHYGSHGATLNFFGPSLGLDAGSGITLSFTTKYHNELGKSKTAQFRRFYLDTGPHGGTYAFNMNAYANYSTSAISLTRTITLGATLFQDRIDFGVPAKSLSFEVARGSTAVGDKVQGYTVEFRYQRDV